MASLEPPPVVLDTGTGYTKVNAPPPPPPPPRPPPPPAHKTPALRNTIQPPARGGGRKQH